MDFALLEKLGINDIGKNAAYLDKTGFTYTKNGVIYINNYNLISTMLKNSLKNEVKEFLVKTLISKLGKIVDNTTLSRLMGNVSMFKEEYMLLWKNSQLAIKTGDYDAYLKNCLEFLSITDKISNNISYETIEANKKEVYQNILMSLYAYSPAKIYSIEKVLLMDAIEKNDNEKISKLSNLMLQGALISSNYTDAISHIHNILSKMENPSLIVKGEINIKFFLLSLVNIEILFNIGDYDMCISTGEDIIKVLNPEILEKVKPSSFSLNFFLNHLMETFRLVCFAKLLTCDKTLEMFLVHIKNALNEDLPEKGCILALKEFLAGKNYVPSGTEEETAFSKVIYLLLQELSNLKGDYKQFAQNIYQAKLLASDIHQTQLEYICDMLIAYAYAQVGAKSKANAIYNDIYKKSENSAIFNLYMLVRYFKALENLSAGDIEGALLIINNALADIQKNNNNTKVFYAMFEKLYIKTALDYNISTVNINAEKQKLLFVSQNFAIGRIIKPEDALLQASEDTKENIQKTVEENNSNMAHSNDLTDKAQNFDEDSNLSTEVH